MVRKPVRKRLRRVGRARPVRTVVQQMDHRSRKTGRKHPRARGGFRVSAHLVAWARKKYWPKVSVKRVRRRSK